MDGSPLILAQSHSRRAFKAGTSVAAINEHDRAAGQFAQAAQTTKNSEALRTLRLLEQHHQRLAQILRSRTANTTDSPEQLTTPSEIHDADVHEPSQPPVAQSPTPSPIKSPYRHETRSLAGAHRPQRDMGSTITSNLASARGIPSSRQRKNGAASSPTVSQQNAEGKILNPSRQSSQATNEKTGSEANSKPLSEKETRRGHGLDVDRKPQPEEGIPPSPNMPKDQSFDRFYSAFETVFSKLSAPLAFAGLPLRPDADGDAEQAKTKAANENTSPPSTNTNDTASRPTSQRERRRPKPVTRATASPEYSHLFSSAALRAIREDPSNAQFPGTHNFGAAESFYLVPTSGGHMTYASVLARQRHPRRPSQDGSQEAGQGSKHSGNEDDEFVDARESFSSSPVLSTKSKPTVKSTSGKTLEELDLENSALRALLDELSRRLWQFEMSSQLMGGAAMAATHASLPRQASALESSDHKPTPKAKAEAGSKDGKSKGSTSKVDSKDKEDRSEEMVTLRQDNARLRASLGKYKDRWDKLKERARQPGAGASPSKS